MKKMIFMILATVVSVQAFANDITNRIPEGRHKGSNAQGSCWVFVRMARGEASLTVSKVAPNVSPGAGQSIDFHESSESETARNSAPDQLTITNYIKPNDSFSRKKEVKLVIKNQGAKTSVRVSTREKFLGFWSDGDALGCTI